MAKRRMTKMFLHEISAVDKPAQEPCLVAMFKSASAIEEDAEKAKRKKKPKPGNGGAPAEGSPEEEALETPEEEASEGVEKDKDEHGYGSNPHGGGAHSAPRPDRQMLREASAHLKDPNKGPLSPEHATAVHQAVAHAAAMGDHDALAHFSAMAQAHEQRMGSQRGGLLFGATPGGGAAMSKLAPKKGEKQGDYLSRFMGDEKMRSEYPDEKQRAAVAYSMFGKDGYDEMGKREFSAEERSAAADSGAAMPDGSFPIKSKQDLHNAMQAIGRAKNPGEVKAHIRARAKALGLESELSDAFKKGDDSNHAGAAGITQENAMTPQEIEALQKRAERAEKVAKLNDAEKQILATLEGAAAESFLDQTPEQRTAEVAKRGEQDPVVYTALDGETFRKSEQRLANMAKKMDEETRKRLAAEKEAKIERLSKRAGDEFGNLPGEVDAKIALLELVELLPVEKKAKVEAMLKAHNEGMSKAFETVGSGGGENADANDGEAKLEQIAKSLREKNPKLSPEQSMLDAMNTPEGREAYLQSRGR